MESPSNSSRRAIRYDVGAAVLASVALFLLSGWLGVRPGRPAALRSDVIFQCDAGQRIDDTLTGRNSFGLGTHLLIGKTWPHAIGALNRLFPNPEVATVYLSRAAAALGAGIGLGFLIGCLRRVGWSAGKCLAALAFLLASSDQIVACLPDHFAFSSGLLPASFGIYLLGFHRSVSRRTTFAMLAGASILAASICLTNGLWPALLALALALEGRRIPWRVAGPLAILGLVGFAITLKIVERHGHRWPVTWQAKHWLHFRLVNDPAAAALRAGRGCVDPIVAPSPTIDTNNLHAVPMLTFEPTAGMPPWPFDAVRSLAAVTWIVVLVMALRTPWTPPVRMLAIWIGWNLVFHNLWGDEFFLYSPHYGWALALLPFVSERIGWKMRCGLVVAGVGQMMAFAEVAERVREIAV